jgi:hypothetical protein
MVQVALVILFVGFVFSYRNCERPLETVSHAGVYIFSYYSYFSFFSTLFLPTLMKTDSDVESGFPNPRAQEEGNVYY